MTPKQQAYKTLGNLIIKDMMNKMTAYFYDCDISINDLLRKSGYAYFSRKFKQIMGVSPKKYMIM